METKNDSKNKKRTGRPKKEIDENLFENLCAIFCTQEEIAGIFNCSIDTINNWCKRTYGETFSETFKKKSAKGKTSLRRWQFKAAENGNVSMMIFLGKNYLGQSDRTEIEVPDTQININVSAADEADIDES